MPRELGLGWNGVACGRVLRVENIECDMLIDAFLGFGAARRRIECEI